LQKEIPKHFLVFQASGLNRQGDVLFTGYYQPVIDARKKPEGDYKYPVYKTPRDLQVLDLGKIDPGYTGQKIGLRVEKGIVRPYFDREAIDEDLVLKGKGLELVYLRDFLDRYLLHIQGSGIMNVENSEVIRVRFASSNCFPYVSLGKLLIEDGKIPKGRVSLKAIRQYYREHPEEMKKYLNRNHRYIFFEEFTGNITGSEGVELTPGRSIATDKSLFPGGGLAFVICRKPVRNAKGEVVKWRPMNRFMIDQDTGSAIKGPGRVDIFWGTGKEAGQIAGGFKETGKLYYLLIKEEANQLSG
ncbi:MAG: MltA domain-containing protein, partial [Deltaproteobacteria bacterium]|nr:MltA domain-containing protein [Deltaproteobacteria bacterium]